MAQMRITAGAHGLGADDAKTGILFGYDGSIGDRLGIAGPAGAGIELIGRLKQIRAATDAGISARCLVIVVTLGKGALGACSIIESMESGPVS